MKNIKLLTSALVILFTVSCISTKNVDSYKNNAYKQFIGLNKVEVQELYKDQKPSEIKKENGKEIYIYTNELEKMDRKTKATGKWITIKTAYYFNEEGLVEKVEQIK